MKIISYNAHLMIPKSADVNTVPLQKQEGATGPLDPSKVSLPGVLLPNKGPREGTPPPRVPSPEHQFRDGHIKEQLKAVIRENRSHPESSKHTIARALSASHQADKKSPVQVKSEESGKKNPSTHEHAFLTLIGKATPKLENPSKHGGVYAPRTAESLTALFQNLKTIVTPSLTDQTQKLPADQVSKAIFRGMTHVSKTEKAPNGAQTETHQSAVVTDLILKQAKAGSLFKTSPTGPEDTRNEAWAFVRALVPEGVNDSEFSDIPPGQDIPNDKLALLGNDLELIRLTPKESSETRSAQELGNQALAQLRTGGTQGDNRLAAFFVSERQARERKLDEENNRDSRTGQHPATLSPTPFAFIPKSSGGEEAPSPATWKTATAYAAGAIIVVLALYIVIQALV